MNLLASFHFAEEFICQEFKESPLLILHELATDYSAISGRVVNLKGTSRK